MSNRNSPSSFFLRRLIKAKQSPSNGRYSPIVLDRLIVLMDDHDDTNRDWATFFVALSQEDGGVVTEMLLDNATDQNPDIAAEAILGLARRRHPSALRFVKKALDRQSIGMLDIKAAGYVANRTLLSRLMRIQKWWPGDDVYLKAALESCKNNGRDDYNFD